MFCFAGGLAYYYNFFKIKIFVVLTVASLNSLSMLSLLCPRVNTLSIQTQVVHSLSPLHTPTHGHTDTR